MAIFKSRFLDLFVSFFSIVSFGIFLPQNSVAQDPIQITINVLPPYPNYADEVIQMGDQTIITLQNTDLSTDYSLKLGVELSGDNGIIVRSKENTMPNTAITIMAGETVVMTGDELSNFYNNYSENDFDFIGITRTDIINNQQLPDGAYSICVRAYDYASGIPLSATSPQGCTAPFFVVAIDPPIITYPQNQLQLQVLEPQLISINWIPVSIALPDLRYRLEMVDLTDMPINVYDAFETGDFLFFTQDDIISNTYLYGMENPLLTEGHEYAIRVRAYRLDGLLNVTNSGYSDVVTFTYGEITQNDDDESEDDGADDIDEIAFIGSSLPDQNMDCGTSCSFILSGNETAITQKPQIGSILQIGNFQLKIMSISGSGTFNGSGVIQATNYIPVGIQVAFENIQINSDGRVIAGTAKAQIRNGSWIDQTWADITTEAEDININTNDYGGDFQAATDPQYYIDNLEALYENVGTTIPISIGQEDNSLQIVGMNFFPDRASYNLSYILELADDPTGERYLHFMAKDLCITPGGPALSSEEANLQLIKPFRYTFDNSTQLIFYPPNLGVAGTYLNFDCNGFNGIHAAGEVVFNPNVIKPVTSDGDIIHGDTVKAGFITSFVTWSDWVATVSFDTENNNPNVVSESLFMYKELDDYIIKVQSAYIDHSINSNPATMAFPENYTNNSSPDWQGVYLKTIRVDLPKWVKAYDDANERISLTGNDIIIDNQGFTGIIHGGNILSSEDGALGKWPVTIDSLRFRVDQNSLAEAFFRGSLKIPVIEEAFDYTADLQFLQGNTKHTFTFNPLESYTIPTWFAETTLENNSALTVTIAQNKAFVEANLNGKLSFSPVIGGIDKMNLTDITFEQLIIRSEKDPTYIEIGDIGTGISGQTLAVAGFGIALNQLQWIEEGIENTGLDMEIGMDLAGAANPISGETGFFIKNTIKDFADSMAFTFEGTKIKDIHLAIETGAVNMDGTISFFRDDPKFGNGFDGSINLSFLESISIDGTVMFGNTVKTNGSKLYYFYAYAMAYMPTAPVPMATPLDVYGFGGGVYYNLSLDTELPNPGAVGGSNVNPREIFNVQQGILGLQASVVVGLTPSSRTFNADVTLSAEININTGGLNLVALTGSGYLMQKIDEPEKDQAMITANVAIMYDFPNRAFQAQFGVLGNIPKQSPLLTVDGEIDIRCSPTLWYLKAGFPTDPLNTTLNLGLAGVDANAYFMTGRLLPPPVLPQDVQNFFQFNSNLVNNTQNGLGIGFMAGIHAELDVAFELLSTGISITANSGVDIAVLNYFAATCNGSENFGVNKWYAQGQGYMMGSFRLSVFSANVASLALGIIVEGAFPNPTGIRGRVKAELEVLVVEETIDESFTLGSFCDIQPLANASELIDRKEKELDNLEMIGIVTPSNGLTNESTFVHPTIEWYFEDGEYKRFTYGDGMGGIIDKLFRIRNEFDWLVKTENGSWADVTYTSDYNPDVMITRLTPVNSAGSPSLLSGMTDYKIVAKSFIEKFDGSPTHYFNTSYQAHNWTPATYLTGENAGSPIIETVSHTFKTETNLTEIEELFVDYTLPFPRQRFYPYGYLNVGKIDFNVDQEAKFQDFESCGFDIHAEFTPLNPAGNTERKPVTRPNLLEARFDMASLSPETIYRLEIVAERRTTTSELYAETNQNCAMNNSQDVDNLLASHGLNVNLNNINQSPILPGLNPLSNNIGINNIGIIGSGIGGSSNSADSITQRKILYTIHFRTSKYATPQEKLNSISVAEVNMNSTNLFIFNSGTHLILKDAHIKINCGEGFDKYDLFGHDYPSNETREYFRAYGPGCNSSGLGSAVHNWYESTCYELYSYGSSPGNDNFNSSNDPFVQAAQAAQAMADGQRQLWEIDFRSDPANYTGTKYVQPLLSDVELGLAEPTTVGTYVPMLLPLYVGTFGQESAGNNSGGSMGAGNSGFGLTLPPIQGSAFGNFNPNQNINTGVIGAEMINFGGEPELELVFKPDRTAYEMRIFLMNNFMFNYNPSGPFVHPPSGIYPIRFDLSNTNYDANPGNANNQSKTFDINLPFQ